MSSPDRAATTPGANLDRTKARNIPIATAVFVSFGIYFGLHLLTRCLVSHNLQLDEAEQLILTQDWRWGYGSQPPLYTWMQKALFEALGANVFALSLLKNVCLWAAYIFTFLASRDILPNARLAEVATASLLFFPQIAWESQRDQSHLVLATTLAAATLWIYVRLLKTRDLIWYFLLGIAIAFGFLAKYNYLLLPVALVGASLTTAKFRRAVLTPKVLISIVVFVALTSPHILWMLDNKAAVASQSYKFMAEGGIAPKTPFAGILQLLQAFVAVAVVPSLIFSPFLIQKFKTKSVETNPLLALLTKTFILGLTLSLILVLVFHVTYLRDRWLQPLLFALPILFVGLFRDQLTEVQIKRLLAITTLVAVVVLTAINVTVVGANILKRSHNMNIPYSALASELRKNGFGRGTIIANGFLLGGNLKNQFSENRTIVPELDEKTPPQRPTLIIWSARTEALPNHFLDYAAQLTGAKRNDLHLILLEIPCENGRRKSEKFGYILLR
jgi:4-amino-4-deoxy-L-arabinose transferase-like glycosyltransferase